MDDCMKLLAFIVLVTSFGFFFSQFFQGAGPFYLIAMVVDVLLVFNIL